MTERPMIQITTPVQTMGFKHIVSDTGIDYGIEQIRSARTWVEARDKRIKNSQGFIVLKRYTNSDAYGIHDITGLHTARIPGSSMIRRSCVASEVVGLVGSLGTKAFLEHVQHHHKDWASLSWGRMTPQLRHLILTSSTLPMEWKFESTTSTDFLNDRVHYIADPAVLRFLNS